MKVAGILNITPDSFSDGGLYLDPRKACDRARQMVEEGADMIDVGAESTRPGAMPVDPGEEMERLRPVLKSVVRLGVPVSVDTRRAAVARVALAEGARWINDISALGDPEMAPVVSEAGAGLVIMHMKGEPATMQEHPHYENVVEEVTAFLSERLKRAREAGIREVMVDPGLGFGKRFEDNIALMKNLKPLRTLGVPVFVGFSRKRFVRELFGEGQVCAGNQALTAIALLQGVDVVRVHDVGEARKVIQLWGTI